MMSTSFTEREALPTTPEPTENRPAVKCAKRAFLYDAAADSLYTIFVSSMLITPTEKPDHTCSISVHALAIFTLNIVFLIMNLINLRLIHLYTTPKMRCCLKTEYLLIGIRFGLFALGNYELFNSEYSKKFSLNFSLYLISLYFRVRHLFVAHSYFTRDNRF